MIQIRIDSKQHHGNYYTAKIYESSAECRAHGGVIVDYRSEECVPGTYVKSIEGLLVPVLKVAKVSVNTFIYFPKLRFNTKRKHFSYNLDLVCQQRYRLTSSERLFAGHINSGLNMFDAAMRTWQGKKHGYYVVAIKRLFNDTEFTNYLFSIMGATLREELEARGINKGTIADEIAIAIKQKDSDGNPVRVPQNVRLWALGKASDVLERGGQQGGNVTNNVMIVSPDAIREQMQSKLSPNGGDHQELALTSGNPLLEVRALPEQGGQTYEEQPESEH